MSKIKLSSLTKPECCAGSLYLECIALSSPVVVVGGVRPRLKLADNLPAFLTRLCEGPEITDELVRVLRRRLDEATLDIITVMLVRNCKLTPADVEVSCLSHQHPSQTRPQVLGTSGPECMASALSLVTAVHPASWEPPLRGAASGPASVLQTLASSPGLVPPSEPTHLPALPQVHRQQ